MAIRAELDSELKDAIRERDRRRSDVIRQLKTDIAMAVSAPDFEGDADSDELYEATIASYVKKMQKAKAEFERAGERGRAQAEKLGFEIEYLSRWLPSLLGEDETKALVRSVIAELGADDPKMTGKVIGHVMKSGEALDGAIVNRLVREELGA